MRMIDRLLLVPLVLVSCGVFAEDSTIAFAPTPATRAVLRVDGHSVTFDIVGPEKGAHRGEIGVDTENPIHVAVDDYSFDGRKGFSIWSVDEGMGVYTIHRVFLYSIDQSTFVEAHPACGHQFINLKVDKLRRWLTSTYYEDNIPRLCMTRLPEVRSVMP
ncbi:hypothetical protein [Cupriavidus basilensis]|uniref:hypothetical protein n=1 Tax=Cupriavidus basilensis TaxID=68895 RepID=UPI00157B98F7|nr:hypothetical protein [Cupriavidus basilensis]NUA28134.1 hypothetical protein [Cupriavidus basilensis]